MRAFDLSEVIAQRARANVAWLEFVRCGSLSVGVYHLRAGQDDPQKPHGEDEVYHVMSGRASFRAGADVVEVGPGSVLFVGRLEEHRFFDVREDLTALVFFAPPEGSVPSVPPAD